MIELTLKYKGARHYIHGGDFYNAIDEHLTQRLGGHLTRLAFKRFARNQCRLLLEPPTDMSPVMGNGSWCTASGEAQRFWLYESDTPVTASYPFDEDAITTAAAINENSILGQGCHSYTAIENIIALTKMLNYVLTPDIAGKWLFGQLDVNAKLPSHWDEMRIERYLCMGSGFSRHHINIDGNELGEIRFIVGEP